jgi:hypothetical protein
MGLLGVGQLCRPDVWCAWSVHRCLFADIRTPTHKESLSQVSVQLAWPCVAKCATVAREISSYLLLTAAARVESPESLINPNDT